MGWGWGRFQCRLCTESWGAVLARESDFTALPASGASGPPSYAGSLHSDSGGKVGKHPGEPMLRGAAVGEGCGELVVQRSASVSL